MKTALNDSVDGIVGKHESLKNITGMECDSFTVIVTRGHGYPNRRPIKK